MIEVKTKFNVPATKAFITMNYKRTHVILSIILLYIIFGVIIFATMGLFKGTVIIVFSIFGAAFVAMILIFSQNLIIESMMQASEATTNYFKFNEDKIYQEMVKGDALREITECEYSLLWRVYEDKKYFFLYMSSVQAHVILKEDIETGDVPMLRELLKRKLGKKFKTVKLFI